MITKSGLTYKTLYTKFYATFIKENMYVLSLILKTL